MELALAETIVEASDVPNEITYIQEQPHNDGVSSYAL